MKRFIAATIAALALTLSFAGTASAAKHPGNKVCSPGQHGNPQPGFKPGSCK